MADSGANHSMAFARAHTLSIVKPNSRSSTDAGADAPK
jgi:hypothetical protein